MPKILLVDDDPDNRHLLQVWLTAMGHQVHAAASAVEALQVLDEHGVPDIAILDIVMDQISGLDLLHHLRRHQPLTALMPAILLTARELHTDHTDACALNAVLMKKPPEKAGLSAAISQALQVSAANRAFQRGVILLVEDNPDDAFLIRRAFEQNHLSHEVVVARDGVEALALLLPDDGQEPLRPQIVLLDLDLPRIGGLEVLARLRENATTRTLPIIVLTSAGEEQAMVESYGLGANSYVRKPGSAEEFLTAAKYLGVYWLGVNKRTATSETGLPHKRGISAEPLA